ncbi:MAG: metallophosphoesterase [Thiotrichales bacterium]|nr:MAG: metallophosphoesterase [Thiotrichales bacterium]
MKSSLLQRIRAYFRPAIETVIPEKSRKLRLSGKAIRIPLKGYPQFRIEMGKQVLHLCPDPAVACQDADAPCDFILFDPDRYFSGISHCQRVSPGNTLAIDSDIEYQDYVFSFPREAFRRQFSVSHAGDALIFKDPISELGTYVSLIDDAPDNLTVTGRRRTALRRIVEIFGGPLQLLSVQKATEALGRVNELLRHETGRHKDSLENPGSLLELPGHITPVLVGDLHARIDNLLRILSENGVMDSLEKGTAALVFLGDAVHSEEPERLEEMDSSLLIMDLIFMLKIRYPEQVFFIVGNHDSFQHEVMKRGIPQGLLWKRHVIAARGEAYKEQLELFYQQSPLLVLSPDFVACHAGPARRKISRQMLVDAHQFPDIVHDLTWGRIRTPAFPGGYSAGDVRQFRKGLEVGNEMPFIVGHHPYTRDDTLWINAGRINQHHIVISARSDRVGIFTRIDGAMVPQVFPAEPLTDWLNRQASAGVHQISMAGNAD